jgi:hypothetical protein
MTDPIIRPKPPSPNRERRRYDRFHETLLTTVPNRTYRTRVDARLSDVPLTARIIRFIAGLLVILLAIRFAINLYYLNNAGDWTTFFYLTTDWAVRPFQKLFGETSFIGTKGFVDWATLAAIITTLIVAWLFWLLLRPKARY